jgi:hypothetical protein
LKRNMNSFYDDKRLSYQPPLWLDERPVLAVHLVVEAARVAQVVAVAVAPPQWRRRRSAVDALAALCDAKINENVLRSRRA